MSPLQLVVANYMLTGNPNPFQVNGKFLDAMAEYCDSKPITDNLINIFGANIITNPLPDPTRTVTGVSWRAKGDDIYAFRRALDCGEDENRFEEIWLGKRKDVAEGTYACYTGIIYRGSVAVASTSGDYGSFDGGGGGGSAGDGGASCGDGGGGGSCN